MIRSAGKQARIKVTFEECAPSSRKSLRQEPEVRECDSGVTAPPY